MRKFYFLLLFFGAFSSVMLADEKLTGTVISSAASSSTYAAQNAFDGLTGTYFCSMAASNTWVGLDLGTPHVIKKVGWASASGFAENSKLFHGYASAADYFDDNTQSNLELGNPFETVTVTHNSINRFSNTVLV